MVSVERIDGNPVVEASDDLGTIVNHPSVIEVPAWVDDPLGNYYLYFSHKYGDYIRLAYADDVEGPWNVYGPGTLHVDDTPFIGHIASPDVHVDNEKEVIRMYYHGETATRDLVFDAFEEREYRRDHYGFTRRSIPYRILFETGRRAFNRIDRAQKRSASRDSASKSGEVAAPDDEPSGMKNILRRTVPIPPAIQETRYVESSDGVTFRDSSSIQGPSWMAVFECDGRRYAMGRDGYLYESDNTTDPFVRRRHLFENSRHFGVFVDGDRLEVYYSRPNEIPESIYRATTDLSSGAEQWNFDESELILCPETEYEGEDVPLDASKIRSPAERKREVRDPKVFFDGSNKYLSYAAAGQSAIAIARLIE